MSERRRLAAGADAGGSRTRLVVGGEDGTIHARSEGPTVLAGGTPVRPSDAPELARRIGEALAELADSVDGSLPLDAFCAAVAGVGRPEDAAALVRALEAASVARRVAVVTDAEAALEDAFPEVPGILVIAGTGSIAMARDADGRIHRSGGRGPLVGDEGSGYALGLEALRAVLRAADGRGPSTGLRERLMEAMGAPSVEDFPVWARNARKHELAALAPVVLLEASRGDDVALRLAADAVEALLGHVRALAPHLGAPARGRARRGGEGDELARYEGGPGGRAPDGRAGGGPVSVALAGGLLEGEGLLRSSLGDRLEAEGFALAHAPVDPSRGALRMAAELLRG